MSASRWPGPGRLIGCLLLLCTQLVLIACAGHQVPEREPAPVVYTEPQAAPAIVRPVPASPRAEADSTFEQRRRERAEELTQADRWAEAAVQWDILALLRPDNAEYAKRLAEAV